MFSLHPRKSGLSSRRTGMGNEAPNAPTGNERSSICSSISDTLCASLGSTRLQTRVVSASPACSSKRGKTKR